MVSCLLDRGAVVEAEDSDGDRAIHVALDLGNPDTDVLASEDQEHTGAQGQHRQIPPGSATLKDRVEIVRLLLTKDADVNALGYCDWTPLYQASDTGHLAAVELLISQHAKTNQIDMFGASSQSRSHIWTFRVVKYLLAYGADDDIQFGTSAFTPAQCAASTNKLDVLKYLLETVGVRKNVEWQEVAFQLASEVEDDVEVSATSLAYIIDNRLVDIDARNSVGLTLLHEAVEVQAVAIVKTLVQRGANPIVRNRNGETPCDFAWKDNWFWPTNVIRSFAAEFSDDRDTRATSSAGVRTGGFWPLGNLRAVLFPEAHRSRGPKLEEGWGWVHMDANDDACFTKSAIASASTASGYDEKATIEVLRFFSESFLEQSGTQPRSKFREPSCNTFSKNLTLTQGEEADSPKPSLQDADGPSPFKACSWLPRPQDPPESGGSNLGKIAASSANDSAAALRSTSRKRRKAKATAVVSPCFDSSDELLTTKTSEAGQGTQADDAGSNKPFVSKPILNVHTPRTLDESYYPGLCDDHLSKRNTQQVVSSMARYEGKTERVLLAPQLWLWKLDNMIITAFPTKPPHAITHHLIVQFIDIKDFNGSGDLVIAWVLSEFINLLDRPYLAGLDEPVFYTFEMAVAITFDEVQTYMSKDGLKSISIEKEREVMYRINDIREELMMIKSVLVQQLEVWEEFWRDAFEKRPKTASEIKHASKGKPTSEDQDLSKEQDVWEGLDEDMRSKLQKILERPNKQIPKFIRRIDKVDKDAERAEQWIVGQLDLKSKHAGLKESHNSLILSTAVIGFTVITVIFAPLSFLSSLFALPTEQLQKHQTTMVDGTAVYSNNYLGGWITLGELASLLVTVIAVWLSFVWLKFHGAAKPASTESKPLRREGIKPEEKADRVWAANVSDTVEAEKKARTKPSAVAIDPSGKDPLAAQTATASPLNLVKGLVARRRKKTNDPEG